MITTKIIFSELYAEPSRNGIYKPKEFHGRGTRIVNMGELFGNDFIDNQDMERVELTQHELDKSTLKTGDLLFGRRSLVESGAGKCSLVGDLSESLTFESSIIRVRPDVERVNPKFLYYYFKSIGRGKISAIVTGTNVKGIRSSDLGRIQLEIPKERIDQDRICEIILNYDDLIKKALLNFEWVG